MYGFVGNDPVDLADTFGLSIWTKGYKLCKAIARERKLVTVATVKESTGVRAIEETKQALKGFKDKSEAVIVTPNTASRNKLGTKLSENGKITDVEGRPGFPEHIHPETGPNRPVHIQTAEATKKAGWTVTGIAAGVFIPNATRASQNPNGSWRDLGLAGAWDIASSIDPIFLTDALEWAFKVRPEDFPECGGE